MITIVCGPPCAGKTTYVAEHAAPTDIVIDFDDIARELGSPARWQHAPEIATAANQVALDRIRHLQPSDNAWVIRCLPSPTAREALAHNLDATVVLLDPGQAECERRAQHRPSGTRKAIALWYWRQRKG
jgi:5-methylcytosine-specific restriction protein A